MRTIIPAKRRTAGVSASWATSIRSRAMATPTRLSAGVADLTEQRLESAGGSYDPELLSLREHDDSAVSLKEAGGVLGDLIGNPVQLNRLRQDVTQLLQREQLADAAVYLSGQLIGFCLRFTGSGLEPSLPQSRRCRWRWQY